MTKVSIIMATYNRKSLLERAISSILDQTLEDWTCVIIDDCSTDGTWELLQATNKRPPKIVVNRNSTNIGAVLSRTPYMLKATGEYIAVLDDDDYWKKDYLEKMVALMDKNTEAEMGVSDSWAESEIRKKRVYRKSYVGKPFPCALPSNTLLRTSTYKKLGGWDPEFKEYHAEVDYYIRAGNKFVFLKEPLVVVSIGSASMSSDKTKSAKALEKLVSKHQNSLFMDNKLMAEYYSMIGLNYIEGGQDGTSWLATALGRNPYMLETLVGYISYKINPALFWVLYKIFRKLNGYI